jgi:hypothetical protein
VAQVKSGLAYAGRLAPPAAETLLPHAGGAAFFVFVLINGTLFIRPAEIVPGLLGLPIYELLNLLCLALALPKILACLTSARIASAPITACVLGLQIAVVLSHLSHLHLDEAFTSATDFGKVLVYYLLLVSLVDSAARLRSFLFWLVCFTSLLTLLSLLHYHGYLYIPAMAAVTDQWGADDGDDGPLQVVRLCAAGIFGNPNDFARILAVALVVCLYLMTSKDVGPVRWLGLPAFLMMGYAIHLTHSRGGLLGVMAAFAVLLRMRLSLGRFLLAGIVAAPLLLILFAGRQLDMTVSSGTGQQRIQLWSEGFLLLRTSPVFGIGMGQYAEELGLVAHNSFVHCFVELGLFGGTLFVGAFYLAAWGPYRLGAGAKAAAIPPELYRLRSYVIAVVAGVFVGYLSSTRSYEIPTYTVLGVSAAFMQVAGKGVLAPELLLSRTLVRRVVAVSLLLLVGTYLYVRVAVNWV